MRNKVYDEITEDEVEEIRNRETPDDEPIRSNGKYVWKTAKRVCDFINAHEDLINITTFDEYLDMMKKVMRVIKEVHITEKKRRHTAQKKRSDETNARTQRTKGLITEIKRGKMRKGEIIRRLESIFGEGSGREIETATTREKVIERITEMSKAEEQFEEWERMRQEAKRKQREDRRLNLFWRKNKSFPTQFGCNEETPEAEETLEFWRKLNNKEASEGWKQDDAVKQVLDEVRGKLGGVRCRWKEFSEEEFDDVLRCTAPWKACGVDSVYSFPIKKCPRIKETVFGLVKKLVEWNVCDRWDDENNWLLEGRTVLIFKGEDRKDQANYPQSPASPQSQRW